MRKQALIFRESRDDGDLVFDEEFVDRDNDPDAGDFMNVLEHYSYVPIRAMWLGKYEGRAGLYAVLDGPEQSVQATVDRLASGLYFVHVVQYFN